MSDRPLNPLLEITSRLEPRLFIDAVLTRWQVIALCLVVCPSFALLFAFLAPANYSASATVRIQSNVSLNALLDQGPQADWELNSKIPVVLEVLNSRPVARSILFELGEIGPQATPREIDLAIEVFHSQLRVFPLAGGIVEIQFQSKDPDKVVRCIRLLMAALREAMVRPQVESLDASVEFLRDQLERIRQELSENETEMQDFLGQSDSQRPEVYEAALDHYSSLLGDYSSAQSDLVAAEQALGISRGRLASYDPRRAGWIGSSRRRAVHWTRCRERTRTTTRRSCEPGTGWLPSSASGTTTWRTRTTSRSRTSSGSSRRAAATR